MPNMRDVWAQVARGIEDLGRGPITRALEEDLGRALEAYVAELRAGVIRPGDVRQAILMAPAPAPSAQPEGILTAAGYEALVYPDAPASGPSEEPPAEVASRFASLDLGS